MLLAASAGALPVGMYLVNQHKYFSCLLALQRTHHALLMSLHTCVIHTSELSEREVC